MNGGRGSEFWDSHVIKLVSERWAGDGVDFGCGTFSCAMFKAPGLRLIFLNFKEERCSRDIS